MLMNLVVSDYRVNMTLNPTVSSVQTAVSVVQPVAVPPTSLERTFLVTYHVILNIRVVKWYPVPLVNNALVMVYLAIAPYQIPMLDAQ